MPAGMVERGGLECLSGLLGVRGVEKGCGVVGGEDAVAEERREVVDRGWIWVEGRRRS